MNAEVIFRIEKSPVQGQLTYTLQHKPCDVDKSQDQDSQSIDDDFKTEDYLFDEINAAVKDVKYCTTNSDLCFISLRKDLVFFKHM